MDYYISDGTTRRGPFPVTELLAQGLKADSLVWAEGMGDWQKAASIPELQAVLAGPAAQPQPAAQPYGQPAGYAQPQAQYGQPQAPYGYPQQGYPQPGYPQPGYPPQYGAPGYMAGAMPPDVSSKKLAAGLCGILLGGFGVHKFILGFGGAGAIQIVITLVTCGVGSIIGLIEGIIYLTKSDEDFYRIYMVERKQWF